MIVKMDFTGVYSRDDTECGEHLKKDDIYLDFRKLQGSDGYCDEEAASAIRKEIRKHKSCPVHFLDNGNYHYLSKFWLEQIEGPFVMAMFDHHTDMQRSALLPLTSCGNWLLESIEENAYLQNVLLVGPPLEAWSEVRHEGGNKVRWTDENADPMKTTENWLTEIRLKEGFTEACDKIPLYISVDKDILAVEEFKSNWDQGTMTVDRLEAWIQILEKNFCIIGLDLCGEPMVSAMAPDLEKDLLKSEQINKKVLKCTKFES